MKGECGSKEALYSIVVVDDEAVIRDGIRRHIDWEAHGYRFIAACEDGPTAMEVVAGDPPDVLLTDISMPFLNGLELADVVRREYPRTKIVLLTGYDRIEYAQEAVQLRVSSFLLKPITPQELKDVLAELKEELDREYREMRDRDRLARQLRESLPLLRERFLNRLIQGGVRSDQIAEGFQLCDLRLPDRWIVVVALDSDIDPGDGAADALTRNEIDQLVVRNTLGSLSGDVEPLASFGDIAGRVVFLIDGGTVGAAAQRARECAEQLRACLKPVLGTTVSVGVGTPVDGPGGLSIGYKRAVSALSYRFVAGPDRVTEYAEFSGETAVDDRRSELEALTPAILSFSPVGAGFGDSRHQIAEVIDQLRAAGGDIGRSQSVLFRVLSRFLDWIDELGIEDSAVFDSESPFDILRSFKTLDQVEQWFNAVLEQLEAELQHKREHRAARKAGEAREFIRSNYTNPDLSLEDVCRAIGAGTSYFSQFFKTHTGKTFVEYLTAVRVEEAQKLLVSSSLLTYEIAAQVGFRDANYFSIIFKRVTGKTPTEFRKLNSGE